MKLILKNFSIPLLLLVITMPKSIAQEIFPRSATASFASDVTFLASHTDLVVLRDGDAAVAVAPAYQGRVMTSTFDHDDGPSFG